MRLCCAMVLLCSTRNKSDKDVPHMVWMGMILSEGGAGLGISSGGPFQPDLFVFLCF